MLKTLAQYLLVGLLVAGCSAEVASNDSRSSQPSGIEPLAADFSNLAEGEILVIDRFSSRIVAYSPTSGEVRASSGDNQFFAYSADTVPITSLSYGDSLDLAFAVYGTVNELARGDESALLHGHEKELIIPIDDNYLLATQYDIDAPVSSRLIHLESDGKAQEIGQFTYPVSDALISDGRVLTTAYDKASDSYELHQAALTDLATHKVVETELSSGNLYNFGGETYTNEQFPKGVPSEVCAVSCVEINDSGKVLWLLIENDDLVAKITDFTTATTTALDTGVIGFDAVGNEVLLYTNTGTKTYNLDAL